MARRFNLFSNFLKFRVGNPPSDRKDLPIVDKKDELVNLYENQEGNQLGQFYNTSQLNEFRRLSQDRASQYDQFDEMATDSVIAAALEIYADDATQIDERGRIIWVESDSEEITKAGDRLLDIFEIPERAWKHIYCACKYGDYYLKLYRLDSENETTDQEDKASYRQSVRIVNDKVEGEGIPNYEEYVEDVDDPATIFDLRLRGKTAGFVEVTREDMQNNYQYITNTYSMTDVTLYKPDRLVHIMVGEALDRAPEKMTIKIGDMETTYNVAKGKSILHDVYPIQKEIQLLEDALLLNRLTRSSLIRLLEIEVGDMPKKEVNNYLRRMKNLIEQHIAMDKTNGNYKSYQAPGPIDNVIYIPVKNGRGHIDINNLGGDVNVKDIADIDYFNNKRAGALKIPRAYLGEDMDGCLRGETKLLLLNGQHRSVKFLYENRDEYIGKGIMSCNEDGTLVPTTITNIKLTRKNATFVRIHLDNGEYFDVTEDHLCMMRDGSFKWAEDLRPDDSLMPMYDRVESGRRYVWDNKEESWKAQYRLVALHKYGELLKGHQVHHLNERKIDDDFDNLEQITTAEHYKRHSRMLHEKSNESLREHAERDPEWYKDYVERSTKGLKGPKSESHKRNISKALKGKPSNHPFEKGENNPSHFMTEETRRKISEANTGRKHTEEAKRKISEGCKGKIVSEETRRKLSESHPDFSGKNNPMYGRSVEFTEERKKTYSEKFSGSGNPCYGKKLCNNGVVNKYISSDILEEFLKENPDWQVGSLKKNKAPYNHKVVKVERLYDIEEDAYDIEVANESHTFILDAGVFVHNSGLSNGGSLTKLSSRYARTIMRIQTAYIRAITTLLNLFFIDKKLDYVNKFTVRMTSPATQDDSDRVTTLGSTVDLISSIMSLMESLQGETQKKILNNLVADLLKMPEIAQMIEEDKTPSEDIEVNGEAGGFGGGPDFGGMPESPEGEGADMTDLIGGEEESGGEEGGGSETEFTDEEFAEFEDEL